MLYDDVWYRSRSYVLDSGSSVRNARAGSSPASRTIVYKPAFISNLEVGLVLYWLQIW